MSLPFLESASYGGAFGRGVNLTVVHSLECPLRAGYARSLGGPGWFGGSAGTSPHTIHDPAEAFQTVPETNKAWHVGYPGNEGSIGDEHAGRAAFSREEWTTPDGLAMIARSARNAAARHRARGIPWRWLSVPQVAAAFASGRMADGGLCTHNDISLALGGTDHWDPGPRFPFDLYLAYGAGSGPTPTPADFLEEIMAVKYVIQYVRQKGDPTVWSCNLLANTRKAMTDPAALENDIYKYQEAGFPVQVPAGAYGKRAVPEVNHSEAFGTVVK